MKYIWASIAGKGSVNSGNTLIENCLKKILNLPSPALTIDIFRENFPTNINNFDFIVLPGSTTLYPDLGSLRNLSAKIPIFCFGGSIWFRGNLDLLKKIYLSTEKKNDLFSFAQRIHRPIGCRDPFTCELLKAESIRAEFIGCPTLFYEADIESQDYIAFSLGRKQIEAQLELLSQLSESSYQIKVIIHENSELGLLQDYRGEIVKDENKKFETYACSRCIITGRLHGALPGMALGKPVFFFRSSNEFDSRLSLLNFLELPVREISNFNNLNLSKVEYNREKIEKLKETFVTFVKKSWGYLLSQEFSSRRFSGNKFMNVHALDFSNIQLGDYRFRKDKRFIEIVYLITQACNFNCKYCVGWHGKNKKDSLTDRFPSDRIVDDFRYLEQKTGQQLFIALTGGEPTLISNFVKFTEKLTKYFFIQLETNLCTKFIQDFAKRIDPKRVGQIQASFHEEILDKKSSLEKLYFKNFESLMKKKFSIALKIIAMPERLDNLENKLEYLRNKLPKGFPILIQPFIDAKYPVAYSSRQKEILSKLLEVRREEALDCIHGAGNFKGMKCGAGSSFIMMDNFGNAYPCHPRYRQNEKLGNLINRNIQFYKKPQPCPDIWCGCVLRGLWYGVNPWDYLGKKREDCKYCRFA